MLSGPAKHDNGTWIKEHTNVVMRGKTGFGIEVALLGLFATDNVVSISTRENRSNDISQRVWNITQTDVNGVEVVWG